MPPVQRKKAAPDRAVEILLIEDTPDDARRTIRAIRKGLGQCRVTVAEDGEEALKLLRQRTFSPDLILLDWYLPRKGGREVLDEIKSDPNLRPVPIVVLTVSDRQEDVAAAYDSHASSFVTKPTDAAQFGRAIQLIGMFWKGRPERRMKFPNKRKATE
jgi:two-component system, chemotaxis family, response regulator Rcp1